MPRPLLPGFNPFRQVTAREVVYLYLLMAFLSGAGINGLQQLTGLAAADPFWTSIRYISLMVPLAGGLLWRIEMTGGKRQFVLGKLPRRTRWSRLFGLTIATLVTSLGSFMLFAYLWYSLNPDSITKLVDGMTQLKSSLRPTDSVLPGISRALTFFTLIIAAPLTEEVIFRGILLQRWATKWNTPIALLLTSALFGILHLNFIGAGILGLVAGVLYYQTKSLWAPVALHAINNTIASLSLVLPANVQKTSTPEQFEQIFGQGWTGLIWLAVALPWVVIFLRKNWPRKHALIPYELNQSAAVMTADSV
ncbi:CPBP family intramembrane metalloprotease [filamentous cyanobacterium LEGE 11480]|uniref:CPBP family intramembrane metalloprotease n=1 Tax=Romeriopsis navalis LEGE 11480 TaxID=2777977 RepID=A0A928VL46_9CYAN|nr:type II CAAX endopeptidase family protein [Romeriopsis navalis]MBE9029637.1 CPBP family intramembrane metalloprotease [Romeriopsis navalis LEGE 11480]